MRVLHFFFLNKLVYSLIEFDRNEPNMQVEITSRGFSAICNGCLSIISRPFSMLTMYFVRLKVQVISHVCCLLLFGSLPFLLLVGIRDKLGL